MRKKEYMLVLRAGAPQVPPLEGEVARILIAPDTDTPALTIELHEVREPVQVNTVQVLDFDGPALAFGSPSEA